MVLTGFCAPLSCVYVCVGVGVGDGVGGGVSGFGVVVGVDVLVLGLLVAHRNFLVRGHKAGANSSEGETLNMSGKVKQKNERTCVPERTHISNKSYLPHG